MDLRNAAFALIFRDAVLRPLLVNYANRLEHGHAPEGMPTGTCFVRLTWPTDDSLPAAAGRAVLTAQVHMPQRSGADDPYLDFILGRLRTTLAGGAADELISTRCLETTPGTSRSPFDTIYKAATFEIAPRSPQRRTVTIPQLAPWTGWAEVAGTAAAALRGGTPSLN
jgi:hypothetical protein